MANAYVRCGKCQGNFWPSGQMQHDHPEQAWPLKLKYRTRKTGRNEPAKPRTNSPKAQLKTLKPPRHAYGPW